MTMLDIFSANEFLGFIYVLDDQGITIFEVTILYVDRRQIKHNLT